MTTPAITDPRTVKFKGILSFTDGLKDKKKAAGTDDAKEKHSCNVILPADHPKFAEIKAQIMAAIEAAGEQKWKNKDKWKIIAENDKKRVCFRKGDSFKNQDTGEVYAGYAGNWVVSCGTPNGGQKRPKLFDRAKRALRDQATGKQIEEGMVFEESNILDIFYSGTEADVILSFYGTEKGGNGIFCTMESARSHQRGEKMGGGINVSADDFEELEDDGDDGMSSPSASASKPAAPQSDDDLLG